MSTHNEYGTLLRIFQLLSVCGLIPRALANWTSVSDPVNNLRRASTDANKWLLMLNIHGWFNGILWA